MPMDLADLLRRHPRGAHDLLQALREVQQSEGCVPEAAIEALAAHTGQTLAAVRSVVSFYHFLSLQPRGRYTVYLSDSPTDRLLGSEAVLQRLCECLGVREGRMRADGRVSVHRTSCTGLCDQGPAGLVGGRPLTCLSVERAEAIADHIERGVSVNDWPAEWFDVHNPVRRRDQTLDTPVPAGQAVQAALAAGPEGLIQMLRDAGLRGRGGAGFATWQKWQACRQAPGPRVITCNADEGEPGTFKDRYLLMDWADEVIEGMTVAGLMVGAAEGWLYLRGEYEFIAPHLRAVIARREAAGLLGTDVAGSGQPFTLHLHLGAGAYVCGEETALIESVEGKRGIPRTRPPFPVDRGVHDRPTVNNNVETFLQVAQIAVHGAGWFRQRGTDTSAGTRLLSVSGDVAWPGIYEAPWGTRIDEVLTWAGACDVQAVLVGGPSGHLIPADHHHRLLSYEDLPTGGAFTVFDRRRDLVDIARQYTHFFASESCGFCTPCRVGCGQLVDVADRLATGHASERDLLQLRELGGLMQRYSHCGLGQTAFHPLLDVVTHFGDRVAERLVPEARAFDLEAATVRLQRAHP